MADHGALTQRESLRLSVVIPAHNEEGSIEATVTAFAERLAQERIDYEILVIDDGSTDATGAIVGRLADSDSGVRCVRNNGPNGFGFAVRAGLAAYTGDAVAIVDG